MVAKGVYRKKSMIEVLEVRETEVLVCNEGNPSDTWVIDLESFKATYNLVKSENSSMHSMKLHETGEFTNLTNRMSILRRVPESN